MFKNIVLLLGVILAVQNFGTAQNEISISLEQAIQIAQENDPSLRVNGLQRFQNEKLSQGSVPRPASQITFSGDEMNFDGNAGVQSLNFQQNFNHPKVSSGYRDFYKNKISKSEQLLVLNKKEIARHVQSAYYRLVFAKQFVLLSKELQIVYEDFYQLANDAFKAGETNKLPVVSASTLDKKATLLVNHAAHEVEEAKEILNIWLGGSERYDSEDIDLSVEEMALMNIDRDNPHLSIYEIEKAIALKSIDIQKSKLLPQLVTGLSLQSVNGDLLFFGYQAGLNIPLFRKGYNTKIDAAKIDIEIQDEMMNGKRKSMMLEVSRITNHIEHLVSKIEYFDSELLPTAEEEMNLLKEAYNAGEIKYLEFMMSLENYKNFQLERLELMEDYFMSRAELNYWTEIN